MKAPIEIIYNSIGIDNPIGQKINKRELNKVIFTGTLMKIKGVFPLFEAWPEVVSKIPQATLHLFGKDSFNESGISVKALLLQNLMPQLLETVTFYGHVSRQQVFKELNTASVAVFPSITETFGLGPAEAMAQGCPTIFTKLASGPEIINNGVNGILVDPFNPKEIAEAIIRILADKNLAQKIGFEGRKSVENRFSNDVILQQNEKMYQKVIAEFNSTRWKKPLIQKGLYKIDLPHD
jgi:glycosyltransferase involved in cell wall biosynthesis